jgi:hypothetical protein
MRRVLAMAAMLAITLPGCAFSNIDLLQDRRVHIQSPKTDQTVNLPVTITWTASDIAVGQGRPPVLFGVFVDRAPIKPGATLRSVAGGDKQCLRNPSCPDATYLRVHGVYVVDGTQLTLPFLADLRTAHSPVHQDVHTVTIVLLIGDRRDGESAFTRTFYVARTGPV